MKLIIDIEPRYCKDMRSEIKELYYEAINHIIEAVSNGIPYEERLQGDSISHEALKAKIPYLWSDPTDICMLLDLIDNAPTVEAPNEVPIIRINKPLESEQIVKLKKLIEEQMNNDKCVLIPNYCEIIDPAKRPQGEWINHRNDYGHNIADCSECGKTMQWHDEDEDGIPRYCWYCGAKMHKGDAE